MGNIMYLPCVILTRGATIVMQARTTNSHPTVSTAIIPLIGLADVRYSKYTVLSVAIKQYPHVASAIFQTYNDLLLGGVTLSGTAVHPVDLYSYAAQRWCELEVVDLPKCGRCAFRGNRPENVNFSKTITIIIDFH